jgi:hypothetical protein
MSQSRPITAARVLLLIAGVALAVIALLAVATAPGPASRGDQATAAPASQSDHPAKPVEKQAAQAKRAMPAAPATQAGDSGQRVFIDPATGKLREPEPGEIAALQPAAKRSLRAAAAPEMLAGPGGAVGMAVSEDAMSYSVATVNPDGTLSTVCVTGKAKAEGIVKSPAKAKKTAKQEEHNNDR